MTTPDLLQGLFSLGVNSKRIFSVVVRSSEIQCSPESGSSSLFKIGSGRKMISKRCLSMDDVIGCECRKGDGYKADKAAFLVVCAYVANRKSHSTDDSRREILLNCRKRITLTVNFNHYPEYDRNLEEAMKWRTVIVCLALKIKINSTAELHALQIPNRPKLLILVNPFSGPGKALHLFHEKVVPVFAEAGLQYQLIVTEYGGHAKELVQSIDLEQWSGIVIVSGDGLVFEVINGLMARQDWRKAIKMPLGALPGGSGNALSCAICHDSGESYLKDHALQAAFIVAKHDVVPMDLVAVDTSSGKRIYSFLSVGWGMMADVDIDSDRFRHLGGSRFALMAVVKIAGMKSYRGKLSYLPADAVASSTSNSDSSNTDDDDSAAIQTPLLPPLDSPLPDNWITIDTEFILVGAVYQSHLAKDNRMAVHSKLNDGLIHLSWVKTGISRLGMVKLLTSLEEGLYVTDDPYTASTTVVAFRLEPDPSSPPGIMTVDGESIDYGSLQAQVLPSMARVMSIRPRDK